MNDLKLYFTKYLPVKGEIKDGELGLSINNAIYTHQEHLGSNYGKPVRLFLCSRDIQVGDEVICVANKINNPSWKGTQPVLNEIYTWRSDHEVFEDLGYIEEIVSEKMLGGEEYPMYKGWFEKVKK